MKPNRLSWPLAALIVPLGHVAHSQTLTGLPSALPEREVIAVRLERLPERDLKALYLHCSRESSRRLLDFDEAALCSTTGEALKRRSFGGDFDALLAWWRQHRYDEAPDADRR